MKFSLKGKYRSAMLTIMEVMMKRAGVVQHAVKQEEKKTTRARPGVRTYLRLMRSHMASVHTTATCTCHLLS